MRRVPWFQLLPWLLLAALLVFFVKTNIDAAEEATRQQEAAREFGYGQGRYEQALLSAGHVEDVLKQQDDDYKYLVSDEAVDVYNENEGTLEDLHEQMLDDASDYSWYSDENQLWIDHQIP